MENLDEMGKKIYDSVNGLLEKKASVIDTGYDESDFGDAYWLGGEEDGVHFTPRIKRDQGAIVKYFEDLFYLLNIDKKSAKVLDIGAGAGATVNGLRNAGFESYGCEYSASGRKLAKETFDLNLMPCDLRTRLPFKDNQFDFGCCIGVLSMVPEVYMQNAITEVMRVTKCTMLINIGSFISNNIDEKTKKIVNPHHLTNLSTTQYYKLFRTAGAYDVSVIQPPQKSWYGIGMRTEFCGLFSKSPEVL